MLIGVLVDVSGSMENSAQLSKQPTDQQLDQIQSIFSILHNIAENKSGSLYNHEIFILAFGLKDVNNCDLLQLLEYMNFPASTTASSGLTSLIQLLADNGALYNVDQYVEKHLTRREAEFLFNFYSKNRAHLRKFIETLPKECKQGRRLSTTVGLGAKQVGSLVGVCKSKFETEKKYVRKETDRAIESALKTMYVPTLRTLTASADLLHEFWRPQVSAASSTEAPRSPGKQFSKAVKCLEPYIYGSTPMCEAIDNAISVFKSRPGARKFMCIVSDGESSDGNPLQYRDQLRDDNVLVVVCLLTDKNIANPKRLYFDSDDRWTDAQRNMFHMSSVIENNHSAMSVLRAEKWQLPESGCSRLFFQANHPDVIDQFFCLIHRMVNSCDAILDIVGRVTLDKYINETVSRLKPGSQTGGTCYANAIAIGFHLAMRRIVGREGGVPEFRDIRDELVAKFGEGGKTEKVLNKCAPKYRLKYDKVDEINARKALQAQRPLVARFALTDEQWSDFSNFYERNPNGILESRDLRSPHPLSVRIGHAVVLISCNPECLTLMNSWGAGFADGGFFKVRNESVLNLSFYDIFWTEDDLTESEKLAFRSRNRDSAEEFVKSLPPCVKNLPYKCPKCFLCSPAFEFTEHFWNAKCPKCNQCFEPAPLGLLCNSY